MSSDNPTGGERYLKKQMEDPEFAEAFAKAKEDLWAPGPLFLAYGSTVILRPVRPKVQEKTAGGLYLPSQVVEAEKQKPISAIALYEVVTCGPDVKDLDEGAVVWVRSYVADSFDPEASYVAVPFGDIWARLL